MERAAEFALKAAPYLAVLATLFIVAIITIAYAAFNAPLLDEDENEDLNLGAK